MYFILIIWQLLIAVVLSDVFKKTCDDSITVCDSLRESSGYESNYNPGSLINDAQNHSILSYPQTSINGQLITSFIIVHYPDSSTSTSANYLYSDDDC